MGHLTYAGATEYEIDDRMLAHLKITISTKLRRRESFLVSWDATGTTTAGGRVSIWVSPDIALQFHFSGSRLPELNPAWLQAMVDMANSARGLVLTSEEHAIRMLAEQHARVQSINS